MSGALIVSGDKTACRATLIASQQNSTDAV